MAWLGASKRRREAAQRWHAAILARALAPEPYQRGLVRDTLEGRFQMTTLVATLVLRRLRSERKPGRTLADKVYREVFSGFDHALREEGVGDSSIARKMRKMGEAFFGLARALDEALENENAAVNVSDVLVRNDVTAPAHGAELAAWALALNDQLVSLSTADALDGQTNGSDTGAQG